METALKLARQYQVETGNRERSEIISRNQSYHGATLGAMAVSRNKRREGNLSADAQGIRGREWALLLPVCP